VLALIERERERERERGKLASMKLGVLSNPTGSEPMQYDT
jgi:hypothetical protein